MWRGTLESWLQRTWYGGGRPPWWLAALSLPYAGVVRLRASLYRLGWLRTVRVARPVIVVGNVTVGGTGKTPLTLWLAQQLMARGWRVGVILRGYGAGRAGAGARGSRRRGNQPQRLDDSSDPRDVGDEALLIYRRTGCAVAVGRDRPAAAGLLAPEVDLLIADDGLQHLRLGRDFEIAVVDAARGCGNGALLPAGPLREPAGRLARVDQVVVNGSGGFQWPGALAMRLEGTQLHALQGEAVLPLGALAGQRVHAVAGIGHPQRFFALLRTAGLIPVEHPFPDHHRYLSHELQFADTLPVLMTQKDAVKCLAFGGADRWYLPVDALFDEAAAAALLRRLELLVTAVPRAG